MTKNQLLKAMEGKYHDSKPRYSRKARTVQKPEDEDRYDVDVWNQEGDIVKHLRDVPWNEVEELRNECSDDPWLSVVVTAR